MNSEDPPRVPLPYPILQDSTPYPSSGNDFKTLLPASCFLGGVRRAPIHCIADFLKHELSLDRLNDIHRYLWLAGKPRPARALHQHITLGRNLVVTEDTDLHLLWTGKAIYLKPLPRFLLHFRFWKENVVQIPQLYGQALGLLTSYAWLVSHESDFHTAKEKRLLPDEISWNEWIDIVSVVLSAEKSGLINKRYHYGELRLGRINFIYRFMPRVKDRSILRGYRNGYNEYSAFFWSMFAWVFAVFALVTTALAALQVGLGTGRLSQNKTFQDFSVGFTVFSVILIVAAVIGILLLFIMISLYHLSSAIAFQKGRLPV